MESGTLTGGLGAPHAAGAHGKPRTGISKWIFTTDHKLIGVMYIWLGFFFFAVGGIFALLLRTQLAGPGLHVLDRKSVV